MFRQEHFTLIVDLDRTYLGLKIISNIEIAMS